jgi:hypothetical protein
VVSDFQWIDGDVRSAIVRSGVLLGLFVLSMASRFVECNSCDTNGEESIFVQSQVRLYTNKCLASGRARSAGCKAGKPNKQRFSAPGFV